MLGEQMEVSEEQGISETDLKTLQTVVDLDPFADDDNDDVKREADDSMDYDEADLASLKFAEDIKILLIASVDLRVICHFIGCNAVKDVKSAIYKHVTLIGQMNQQCLIGFMKDNGYTFAGEIQFSDGQPIPVSKQTWNLLGKNIVFTNSGYQFFEAKSGKKKDNITALCWTDCQAGLAGITIYGSSEDRVKALLAELEKYTKMHNCIRGSKLRDISMSAATFSEISYTKRHNWENYYYPKHVRDMCKLEIFGFLNATDRYNAVGISKRGILLYGEPGCVLADTKIRVRKISDKGSHPVHIE